MRSYTRLTASPEDNHHVRNLYGEISTPLNQPAGPFVQQAVLTSAKIFLKCGYFCGYFGF